MYTFDLRQSFPQDALQGATSGRRIHRRCMRSMICCASAADKGPFRTVQCVKSASDKRGSAILRVFGEADRQNVSLWRCRTRSSSLAQAARACAASRSV